MAHCTLHLDGLGSGATGTFGASTSDGTCTQTAGSQDRRWLTRLGRPPTKPESDAGETVVASPDDVETWVGLDAGEDSRFGRVLSRDDDLTADQPGSRTGAARTS
ncbi:MAG: hypothetical protein GY788_04735 [bacterium]|nr:hypothetical protein [bacterium]